jgi:hypothetical protein
MDNLHQLSQMWLEYKEQERLAVELRREIEDKICKILDIKESFNGTESVDINDFKIKITGRLNTSIDSELLQDVAAEHGLSSHLHHLFRWKPEISMKDWKACDKSITDILSKAVTTKPSRASFQITKGE